MKAKTENFKLKKEVEEIAKSLKVVHSVIRVPKLCDIFHKEERKKRAQQDIEKAKSDALEYLHNINVFGENDKTHETFIQELVTNIGR